MLGLKGSKYQQRWHLVCAGSHPKISAPQQQLPGIYNVKLDRVYLHASVSLTGRPAVQPRAEKLVAESADGGGPDDHNLAPEDTRPKS